MSTNAIVKCVAAASLFAAIVAGGPAAAQRVIRGYGANEDLPIRLSPPGDIRSRAMTPIHSNAAAEIAAAASWSSCSGRQSFARRIRRLVLARRGALQRSILPPSGLRAGRRVRSARATRHVVRGQAGEPQGGMAGLDAAAGNAAAPPRFAAAYGGRTGKPARRARTLPWLIALPHPRHQRAEHDRPKRVVCCIRMMNEDVTDLYGRLGIGTKVVVM